MGRRTEVRGDLYSVESLSRLARTQKNNRASRRMLGIAHALGGMTISAAARAAGMERQALGDAIKRYNAEGLDGLFDRAKPGRPRKLDAEQEKELSELIVEGPDPDKDGLSAYARRFGGDRGTPVAGEVSPLVHVRGHQAAWFFAAKSAAASPRKRRSGAGGL